MFQAPGDRPLLGDDLGDRLPFTPAVSAEVPQIWRLRAERALTLVQRWRFPLTLLIGILIAAAAFFAYATQSDDPAAESVSGGDAATGPGLNPDLNGNSLDGGALVGAVEGMDDNADAPSPDPSLTTTTQRSTLTSATSRPGPPEASGTGPGTGPASTAPSSTPTTAASTAGGSTSDPTSGTSSTSTTSASTTTTATTVTTARPVAAPPECTVRGGRRRAGVQVESNSGDFAPSYAFYDRDGDFILSTSSLGPPDDYIDGRQPDAVWRSRNSFDEDDVYYVAAEDADGNTSDPVRCDRD